MKKKLENIAEGIEEVYGPHIPQLIVGKDYTVTRLAQILDKSNTAIGTILKQSKTPKRFKGASYTIRITEENVPYFIEKADPQRLPYICGKGINLADYVELLDEKKDEFRAGKPYSIAAYCRYTGLGTDIIKQIIKKHPEDFKIIEGRMYPKIVPNNNGVKRLKKISYERESKKKPDINAISQQSEKEKMNYAHTLEDTGKEFGLTRERIRQIEAKALRKLRHPSRSKILEEYVDFECDPTKRK